jgi:hypothetical protein
MAVVNAPPTAEQLQERAWLDAGRQYMSNCEPQVVKEINNLVKSFPKSTDKDRLVGWLTDKIKTKVRAEAGMTEGIAEWVVFENLPRNTTTKSLHNILNLIDSNLDSSTSVETARITQPTADEEGVLSRTVQARLELAPTRRFLDWAKGGFDVGGGSVADTIYVRRNFADKDVGQLTVDARSKPVHRLLELLRLCGASRQQAEQYLLKEILTALEHTVYRNKILAVHLADTRREEQGKHHRTFPILYSDQEHARMQIFTEDVGVAARIHENDERVRIRLAGDNHVELAFTQIIPREEIEQKRAALVQDRETRALQAAAQYQPARKITRLEAHLKLTITEGQEPIVRGWSSPEVEAALI